MKIRHSKPKTRNARRKTPSRLWLRRSRRRGFHCRWHGELDLFGFEDVVSGRGVDNNKLTGCEIRELGGLVLIVGAGEIHRGSDELHLDRLAFLGLYADGIGVDFFNRAQNVDLTAVSECRTGGECGRCRKKEQTKFHGHLPKRLYPASRPSFPMM